MDDRLQRRGGTPQRLADRLDNAARDVNAVLLALAIGLAVLDFTVFFVFELRDALPSVERANGGPAVMKQAMAPPHSAALVSAAGAQGSGW